MLCRLLCLLLYLGWTAEMTNDSGLYLGFWRSPFAALAPFFASIPGINLSAWQVTILSLAPVSLLRPGAFQKRSTAMDGAIIVSFASIAVTFLWGWARDGDAYNAYYQLWRFLLALAVGLIVASAARNSRDLRALLMTALAAAVTRGALAIYFYWAHVHGRLELAYMTTHDDSLLFVAGVLIVVCRALVHRTWAAWILAAAVSAQLLYAMVLNDRRIVWVELALSLACVYPLIPPGRMRRRLKRVMFGMAPVLALYVVVGWGRPQGIFKPLEAFSTVGSDADPSSLARQEEIRNLLYTFSAAGNPLLGTGWGVPYEKVTSVYANFEEGEWWQYGYLPHNSLLGLAVFAGLVGLFGIWLVVPMAAHVGVRGLRRATRPWEHIAAMLAICILPAYSAHCYGDVGLQSLTCGLLLGVALGVASKVDGLASAVAQPSRDTRAPATLPRPPAGGGQALNGRSPMTRH